MSLNRSEQMILDYVQEHVDERHFWEDKVRMICKSAPDDASAARYVDAELWQYFVERSAVVEPFKSAAGRDGLRKISMRSLAEYWIRVWGFQRPKKKKPEEESFL